MTLSEAIDRLKQQQAKHGNVEMFFDCPFCGKSFTPNILVAVAVHLSANVAPSPAPQEKP